MSFYDWCIENEKQHLLDEWALKKNDNLGPKDISYGYTKKVWWNCPDCKKSYQSLPSDRRRGRDCKFDECRKKKQAENIKKALIERRGSLSQHNPELAREWHPYKNGELTPENISPASEIKVWWLGGCKHEWAATPCNRVRRNSGCPICNNKIILIGFNDLATTHKDLCTEWDYEKNIDTLPTNVVAGTHKKVWWLCEKGHSYKASVSNRSKEKGTGCPDCDVERKSSFNEKVILFYLKSLFHDIQENYHPDFLKKMELDIYIPSLSLAIEYDGEYFHKNASRDIKKNELCFKNGIDVIRIREPKCPILPNNMSYFVRKTLVEGELKDCVEYIVTYANNKYHLNLDVDIDISRDRPQIMEMYLISEKEKSLAYMNPELAKEWHPTKNNKLTPDKITYSSNKRVWWLGKCGHEWAAQVNNRLNGNGCPKCYEASGRTVVHRRSLKKGINDLQTENPNLAKEWHLTKNDALLPCDVLSGSSKKVWWLGKCGHEWDAVISYRNKGGGCPYCANRYVLKGFNDLETRNPDLAAEWHSTKNYDLKPSDVIALTDKKVWWLGKCGHEWAAKVNSRSKGRNCPYCANQKVLKGFNDLETRNPELAKEWHPIKNDVLLPCDVSSGSKKKVWWLGKCNHEWEAKIYKRGKCPICK
ncbi:zinc-ribbon domain-containing protein [Bacillus cereus]|uniref:zinc-ribbon domain-containing protein n=1 Tax=Bacillus cereus TaxID=1396 RepID=UPI002ACB12F7|nr:zinc-ribbon domain-containing protein [Bacillus cereus]